VLEHVVLIQFPEDLTEQELSWIDGLLATWPEVIGGMRSLRWGLDVSGRSRGYQFAIVIAFESEEAARAYQPHPRHQEFARWVAGKGAQVLAFDFPVQPGRSREL
jgi:hypothetical protein